MTQLSCYKTRTTKRTIDIVLESKEQSPMFNGQIKALVLDIVPLSKIRLLDIQKSLDHHIFIEPESHEMQTSVRTALPSSLPKATQEEMLHTIPGLELAQRMFLVMLLV